MQAVDAFTTSYGLLCSSVEFSQGDFGAGTAHRNATPRMRYNICTIDYILSRRIQVDTPTSTKLLLELWQLTNRLIAATFPFPTKLFCRRIVLAHTLNLANATHPLCLQPVVAA